MALSSLPTARRARPAQRRTIGYWYAGMILDLVHMPLVIGLVVFGATIWSGPVYIGVITAIVVLQVALLGCPVMLLTGWLKRRHDPTYEAHWSVTYWLYRTYGRWVGVAVFACFLALALVLRWFLF